MKTSQKVVIAAGAVLLVLNFVFPLTSHPTRGPEKALDDGRVSVTTTARTRFMPIWEARAAHERAELKGNVFSDTIIKWPGVFGLAAIIVATCGWFHYQLGRPDEAPQSSRPKAAPDTDPAAG